MFMSTRYKKRHEPLTRKRPIFSVDDSLAKLCEFLNNESSATKLITPKYKDFRSQKLKFDQKTRLNNAIWRAWHIQYKLKTKARFLQFAAPFSDKTQHSISHAVLLEGKYWKRRLETVSHEFKKWRRLHKEKLLRNSGAMIEEISSVKDDSSSDSEIDDEDSATVSSPASKGEDTLDTLSAMYAFPDILFSSLDITAKELINNRANFKDSSGMMQPSLNHLNPSFDELLENFDFLFTDFGNNQQQLPSENNSTDILMQNQGFLDATVQNNQFIQEEINKELEPQSSETYNVANMMYQPGGKNINNINTTSNDKQLQESQGDVNSFRNPDTYQQLPPQLQAPNLTARIQAAMSTRPKKIQKNKSEPTLTIAEKQPVSLKREATQQPGNSSKRLRQSYSSDQIPETQTNSQQQKSVEVFKSLPQPYVTPILPKVSTKSSVPIFPKVSQNSQHVFQSVVKASPMLLVGSETRNTCSDSVGYTATAPVAQANPSHPNLSYVIVNSVPVITQTNTPVMRTVAKNSQNTNYPITHHSHPQVMLTTQTTSHCLPQQQQQQPQPQQQTQPQQQPQPQQQAQPQPQQASNILNQPLNNFTSSQQNQQLLNLQQNGQTQMSGINETQLVQLAQLLQNVPQGTEATLGYLELLQQQLSLMLKHQQENLQFKHQIQEQAERMLAKQQQQPQQTAGNRPSYHPSNVVQSPVIVSSSQSKSITNIEPAESSHPSTPPERYSRQASTEIPLPKELQAKIVEKHLDRLINDGVSIALKNINSNSGSTQVSPTESTVALPHLKPQQHHQHQQQFSQTSFPQQRQTIDINQLPASSTPTTLDSAIALVALRHGSLSPENTKSLPSTLSSSEGNRITVVKTATAEPTPLLHNVTPTANRSGQGIPRVKQVKDRSMYNEHRRQCHLSAEQRRRGLIKNAFEELSNMLHDSNFIQSSGSGKAAKLSNAAILQNTCDYIQQLNQDRLYCDMKMNKLQQEIEDIRTEINECQKQLPSTGGVPIVQQSSDTVEKGFLSYCKELIKFDRKSWIFCAVMRPLFDSYNKSIRTKTIDEFVESTLQWIESHFTLPKLRLVILDTITKLSTSTSVLDDPNCLVSLADSALVISDPTDINATAEGVKKSATSSSAVMATSASASSSPVWNYQSRHGNEKK